MYHPRELEQHSQRKMALHEEEVLSRAFQPSKPERARAAWGLKKKLNLKETFQLLWTRLQLKKKRV